MAAAVCVVLLSHLLFLSQLAVLPQCSATAVERTRTDFRMVLFHEDATNLGNKHGDSQGSHLK